MRASEQFPTGKVTVEVTPLCIDGAAVAISGRLPRECNCPIALALDVAGFDNPRVGMGTFSAGPALKAAVVRRRRYNLPPAVATFIEHFDDNRGPAPITFEVDADDYCEVEDENDYAKLMAWEAEHE